MQISAYPRSPRKRPGRDRHRARRAAVTLLFATAIVLCSAAVAAATEQLKIVVAPASLSLTAAENEGFTVTVSGTSSKRAEMAVYYQLNAQKSCAATTAQEIARKGDSELEPIPGTPSDPQVFPKNPANFRGVFDWHGELKVFSGEAGPGTYLLCGYLTREDSSGKPLLKISAKFTLTAG
ncbi:MAG TPA: hypothetical protein VK691_13820 [Solirubrobacteraceae bacterium]|jgi:hypothetical protein|nr:hypothetical protein [Solirubrobacteraceae bacterium]